MECPQYKGYDLPVVAYADKTCSKCGTVLSHVPQLYQCKICKVVYKDDGTSTQADQ